VALAPHGDLTPKIGIAIGIGAHAASGGWSPRATSCRKGLEGGPTGASGLLPLRMPSAARQSSRSSRTGSGTDGWAAGEYEG